jgi:type IX secretion system PorP/SprF family membrane protein
MNSNSVSGIFIILSLILFSEDLKGQLPPVTDQYILNPVLINPGSTGERGALSIAALYRRQWAGIKGAPETITLTADAPLSGGKIGAGFTIQSNKIGVTHETSVSGTYSYKTVTGAGNLSLGLRGGLLSTNTRWSELVVNDPGDENFLADSKVYIVPDFGFGAYLSNNRYFAGLSIPRLIGYRFNYDRNRYSLKINPGQYIYLLQGGYMLDIAEDVKFLPSTLISISPGEKTMIDLNAHFGFSERIWAGISYRSNRSMAGLFQFAINNQIKAAYSYYLDFSRLGRFSNGSHEIMLRYDFRFKADIVNPLIF